MNLKLIPTPEFKKSVKKLSKRYALIANDLKTLKAELENDSSAGVHLYKYHQLIKHYYQKIKNSISVRQNFVGLAIANSRSFNEAIMLFFIFPLGKEQIVLLLR